MPFLLVVVSLLGSAQASELRVPLTDSLLVRAEASTKASLRGRLTRGEAFEVLDRVAGADCPVEGWGRLAGGGFACLDRTAPTDAPPVALPRLLSYATPYPADYEDYQASGAWEARPPERLMPFIYARRWQQWRGRYWADLAAWEADAPAAGRLPAGRRLAFVDSAHTERGTVLVRGDGTIVPEAEVYVFPVSRLVGRDLVTEPVPTGLSPAWVVAYEGASIWPAPTPEGTAPSQVGHHVRLLVRPGPAGWWEVPDALGPGRVGWIAADAVRAWIPGDRPAGVADDQLWLDVHLGQNTLGLLRGDTLEYVTVIAPGLGGRYATPAGIFAVTDKSAWWDMASRTDAAESYFVEAVPWVIHFAPRYALHGAYWHWGFGARVSHGCVNLAPLDAAAVFNRVQPGLPPGWHTVYASDAEPGTLIRVRP